MSYEPYPPPPPEPYGYGAPIPPGDPARAPRRGVSFQDAIKLFFSRYAEFKGRSSRSEFWWVELFMILVNVILQSLERSASAFGIVSLLWALAVIVPGLALSFRRLHDTNRSGWWLLLALIPIVGWIILIVWFIQDGKPEGARFDA